MTIVASNSLTLSNVNDGTQGIPGPKGADGKTQYTHTAYSYSADGKDGFTTSYPNLNLLDGTKDFSGVWWYHDGWETDGTYKGLTVKKRTLQWRGTSKPFTAQKDGVYTFSAYVKGSGNNAKIYRFVGVNSSNASGIIPDTFMGNNFDWLRDSFQVTLKTGDTVWAKYEISGSGTDSALWNAGHKWEEGSIATPYMQSASEVTTADWPKYIGHYTDFTQADSTNPSDYTWGPMRGDDGKDGADGHDGIAGKDGNGIKTTVITYQASTNGTTAPTGTWSTSVPSVPKGSFLWTRTIWTYTDNATETGYAVAYMGTNGNNGNDGVAGKDGVGIKTTTITYAGSTNGTTAPNTGWTSTVPTVAAGNYLWTKTVWAYTDNTSETGYSVAKMGNTGPTGPAGAPGNNGDPGKTVSNTEPISLFKGLTWKYSGTTDLTASDGTAIKPNTEYYYNGAHWVINYFSVNNFASESITSDKIDGKNLTITNGEFISKTSNGPVTISTDIKDNHIAISKTDATVNTQNDIALDSEQGLIQNFTNNSTGFYRTAGINFQGPFTNDSNGNYAQLTPQGTKLSTDTPWTTLASTGGFSGGSIQFSIQNGVAYFSVSGVNVPSMTGGTWYQCAQLPTGSRAIPSVNRVTTAFANTSVWGFLVSVSGGLYFQSKNNTSATGNLANVLAAFPIG
ncbi:tail assembly [Lactococcus phage P1046]|uniref:Tail assembly n=1 Tax=Lactococcus phage P1046 TaxID=2662294 RepID=A0A649V1W2_9CAUD|nr:tail assembly [Lactococcus phage P1046]